MIFMYVGVLFHSFWNLPMLVSFFHLSSPRFLRALVPILADNAVSMDCTNNLAGDVLEVY